MKFQLPHICRTRNTQGIAEADDRLVQSRDLADRLRSHREENHLGEAFELALTLGARPPK